MRASITRRAITVAIAGGLLFATAPAAGAAPRAWRVAKTFDTGRYDAIHSVVAFGARNAWAFGGGDKARRGDQDRPTAYHWNGSAWRGSQLPPGATGNLWQSAASSPTNVWAVGSASEGGGTGKPYLLRWNGSKWSIAKRFRRNYISGITVLSPTNVWVFGLPGADIGTGTWHFNGRRWTRVDIPTIFLGQASAVSARNIWAVGRDRRDDSRTVARFDGQKWRVISLRHLLPKGFAMSGIRAAAARNIWATACNWGTPRRSILLHWNGSAWRKFPVAGNGCLQEITPDGQGGLWFVNWVRSGGQNVTVPKHRTAAGWGVAPVNGAGNRTPLLEGLTHIPGTRSLWGAGTLLLTRPNDANSNGAIFRFPG